MNLPTTKHVSYVKQDLRAAIDAAMKEAQP